MQPRLWVAALLLSLFAPQALAQTYVVGSSCSGVTTGQQVLGPGGLEVCNGTLWTLGVAATSSGKVGIGQSTAAAALDVNGSIDLTGNNGLWQDAVNANLAVGMTGLPIYASQTGGGSNGQNNTAVGYHALNLNSTGYSNAAVGYAALASNTTGNGNNAFGFEALASNTTGADNTALGTFALANSTGSSNTATGYRGLQYNTAGTYNLALGLGAMQGLSATPLTGSYNVAVGAGAFTLSQGAANSNTVLGYAVGSTTLATGSRNILVGVDASTDTAASGSNNTLNIGNAIYGTNLKNSTNTSGLAEIGIDIATPAGILDVEGGTAAASASGANIVLTAQSGGTGTTNGGNILINVGAASGTGTAGTLQVSGAALGQSWQTASDARIKTGIVPVHDALAGIAALTGVTYTYRPPAEREVGKDLMLPLGKRQLGVIAQNVESVYPEAVETGPNGVKAVNYGVLTAPVIEAIKTLKNRTDALWAAVGLLYVMFFFQIRGARRRDRDF